MAETTQLCFDVVTKEAIRTRYAPATKVNGSRIIASGDANSMRSRIAATAWSGRRRLIVPYDHALSPAENHSAAALKWLGKHMGGATVAGPGLTFGGDYYFTWTMQRNS